MNSKSFKYLQDVVDAGEAIQRFVCGISLEQFELSELIQRAVEREFEIIGEALNRISRIDEELSDLIPDASKIIGFRNIIAHGYDIIETEIVWDVVNQNLPRLLHSISVILSN